MKDQKEQQIKKSDEEKHFLKLQILQKAKLAKEKQLSINIETQSFEEIDRIKEILGKNFDDPEEKFDLYYKGTMKILRRYLPKGKNFEVERKIIYDEKNIFLTRGKVRNKAGIRGADGRMGYSDDMYKLVDLITDWVSTSQDPVDLYQKIYDLNDRHGYAHQEYDVTSKDFHKAMIKN